MLQWNEAHEESLTARKKHCKSSETCDGSIVKAESLEWDLGQGNSFLTPLDLMGLNTDDSDSASKHDGGESDHDTDER